MKIDEAVLDRAAKLCRERKVVIPTLAQMRDPAKVPEAVKKRLPKIGLWDVDPANLFRISWKNDIKTGALIDAIRARSFVFRVRGQEFWMLYAADARPDAAGFADTRSLLFVREDGLSSKAWPLAEASLPIDSSATVDLDGLKLHLTRTAVGELIIRES